MKTITVNGYTGLETKEDCARMYEEMIARIRRTAKTEEECVRMFEEWIERHWASLGAARYHNAIAGPAQKFTVLRRIATARVRECDDAYGDLEKRTTTAWHAAHHRFVLAACEARARLVELVETANEMHTAGAGDLKYVTGGKYEEMVPAADRQFNLPDLDALRAELDEFVETQRERFAITRSTLAGETPAGFEAPTQPEPAEEPDPVADARTWY